MEEYLEHVEMVSATDARDNLSDLVDRASEEGLRIGIMRHKTAVGAIVPISDLELLEEMDRKAIAERDAEEESVESDAIDWSSLVAVAHIALGGSGVSKFASYLTAQMSARLVDEGVISQSDKLSRVIEIARRTISSALDSDVIPNPPAEVVQHGFVDRAAFAKPPAMEHARKALYYTGPVKMIPDSIRAVSVDSALPTAVSLGDSTKLDAD